MIKDITIRILPEKASSPSSLKKEVARAAHLSPDRINDLKVVRRSVDARKRPVYLNLGVRIAFGEDRKVHPLERPVVFDALPSSAPEVVVVGAGPAGLFAALEAIRLGLRPIVIERGRDVDSRRKDIADISRSKKINPVSNYCFGEGGAGAFSDGKLFTRSRKRGSVEDVLRLLVQFGASPSILIDSHPHIGSDRLPHIIKNIREKIIACGGEVRFETTLMSLLVEDGRIVGVMTDRGEIASNAVILAIGHSSRDTIRSLFAAGVGMQAKGLAVGVRLEHPQQLIDRIQYHTREGRGKFLPAAEYNFVTQSDGRGVYSFCMCPGGVIVPAGSAGGELVVNGMSSSARSGQWANSGMVVEVRPGDFEEFTQYGPLELLEWQEWLERRMFEKAGCSIIAPAQRMTDFIGGEKSQTLPKSSYAPGLQSADFNQLLPPEISKRLKEGFMTFDKKAKGFVSPEGVMIGLESRTSSPVRIVRDEETLQSVNVAGLFPAGEGAGYAGGIVSAAIDGIRCAKAASEFLKK